MSVLDRIRSLLERRTRRLRLWLGSMRRRLRSLLGSMRRRLRLWLGSMRRRLRSLLGSMRRRLRSLLGSMRRRLHPLLGSIRSWLAARSRRWRLAAGGAAVLVLLPLVVFVATRGGGASPEPTTTTTTTVPTTTTTVPTTTTTTAPPPVAPLTGVAGEFTRPALIVKIDNVSTARPQSGLRQADIVIEEPVEGNLTRLAAVFQSTDAGVVGPVRSMRTSDLELIPMFGRPLFAASGGNAGVVPQLHAANVVDIGNNVSGQGFRRDGGRPAPHNLYSSTPELYRKAPETPPPPKRIFRYRSPGERLAPGARPVNGVALRFGGSEISRFTWDPTHGTWRRSQSGTPHMAAEGLQIAPQNVLVAEINYDLSGQLGRSVPHAIVTGYGPAVVLTKGHAISGTWVRPALGDRLRFIAADGRTEIKLTPGQTFIELPSRGGVTLF
jgi:Protein of unknown function (DUF3048) N-terminal domain/Protein of unknown function (DUF3048) C-terminal domain